VLLNIYGPALTAKDPDAAAERAQYKMLFYEVRGGGGM
jgi:hypothetical protein